MPDRTYKILYLGCLLANILCCTACTDTANKDTLKPQSDALLLKDIKRAAGYQQDSSIISNDSASFFMYQGMIIKL